MRTCALCWFSRGAWVFGKCALCFATCLLGIFFTCVWSNSIDGLSIIIPYHTMPLRNPLQTKPYPVGDAKLNASLTQAKCREGYKNVAGVCVAQCPINTTDAGLACQENCRDGFENKVGVCWQKCNAGDKDMGALCRQKCPRGHREVLGVCWKGFRGKVPKTYRKQSYVPVTTKKAGAYVPKTGVDLKLGYVGTSTSALSIGVPVAIALAAAAVAAFLVLRKLRTRTIA